MSFFDKPIRRIAGGSALGIAVLGAATAGALAAATHPVAASAALNALANAVSCATSAACVSGTNSTSGPGVAGTSAKGAGVQGKSTSSNGVSGSSTSGLAGVYGSNATSSGSGVYGADKSGVGVFGQSATDIGVYGIATDPKSKVTEGVVGVSVNGYGLYGGATGTGTGVAGKGGFAGVLGSSSAGYGVEGITNAGNAAAGLFINSSNSTAGTGIVTKSSGGTGIMATASCSNCSSSAIFADAENGAFAYYGIIRNLDEALRIDNRDLGYPIFDVSSGGDVTIAGTLTSAARASNGATVASYSAKTSIPIVEDFGTAQLAGGAAAVPLEATFAASMDPRAAYRVFLTPNGDTHGLYIAAKTPAGFIVRETGGGHGTLSFDYRIVATALGQSGKRMAFVNPAPLRHVTIPSAQPFTSDQTPTLPALPALP